MKIISSVARILCLEIKSKKLSLCLSHSLRLSLIFLFLLPVTAWADQVDTLRPATDQLYANFFAYPGLNEFWEEIDEATSDGDGTYIYSSTVGADYGWIHNAFSTSSVIDSVRLVWNAKSTATSGTPSITLGRLQFQEGQWYSCTYGGGNGTANLTSSYVNYSKTWTVDPCNGSAWTVDGLNNAFCCWWVDNTNVGTAPTGRQNRMTQSYIVVYSHAGAASVKRRSGLVQDEENKGIAEGGMAR